MRSGNKGNRKLTTDDAPSSVYFAITRGYSSFGDVGMLAGGLPVDFEDQKGSAR